MLSLYCYFLLLCLLPTFFFHLFLSFFLVTKKNRVTFFLNLSLYFLLTFFLPTEYSFIIKRNFFKKDLNWISDKVTVRLRFKSLLNKKLSLFFLFYKLFLLFFSIKLILFVTLSLFYLFILDLKKGHHSRVDLQDK